MKTILTTLLLGWSIFAFAQSSAIHPDCEKEPIANQKTCTEEKITNYIKEYLISKFAWSEEAEPIAGNIHLNVSEQGLMELDETHLAATTRQIDLIKEAITRFSYRHMLLPAKENGAATFEYKIIPITIGSINTNNEAPINASSKSIQPKAYSGEIFQVIDVKQMPRFPGCEEIEGDAKAKKDCADKKMFAYI